MKQQVRNNTNLVSKPNACSLKITQCISTCHLLAKGLSSIRANGCNWSYYRCVHEVNLCNTNLLLFLIVNDR